MNALMAAVIMLLGAAVSPRTTDLQVEAVTATGADLPELGDAVARALVMGGARVVMRGPTTVPCEYCTQVKVTELRAGVFRVEVKTQNPVSTTLDLSSGTQLLDRARAIAIHARLLVVRSSGAQRREPEVAALPTRKGRAAPAGDKSKAQAAAVPVAQESTPVTVSEPLPVAPAPEPPPPLVQPDTTPQAMRAPTSQGVTKAPTRSPEAKRPMLSEAKTAKDRSPTRRDAAEAAPAQADLTALPAQQISKPQWPWIPTAIGAGAAIGAGICALLARQKYNGLSDRNQPLDSARSLKSSGESWQTAAIVLSGVAAAGLGVGIAGFATRSSGGTSVKAAVSPIPSGGMAVMAWELP